MHYNLRENQEDETMAKEKRSAGDLVRLVGAELGDATCSISIFPGASGPGSWYAVPFLRGNTPNSTASRVLEIAEALGRLYDLEKAR